MSDYSPIEGSQVYLRLLKEADVTMNYVGWLNDTKVNQFLELRHFNHTYDSCIEYVSALKFQKENLLFGIFCANTDKHIGNVKLGPIDFRYKTAILGLMIGDSSFWGRGVATEAILLVIEFAKHNLGLHKIEAGCYIANIGSKKAFLKAGFKVEGILEKHVVFEGVRHDCFMLGKVLD